MLRGSLRRLLNRPAVLLFGVVVMNPHTLWGAAIERPEIWLTPFPPYNAPGDHRSGAADYLDLFKQDASWGYTAAHVKVFKIYLDRILAMPDGALQTIIQGLAERHIALAIEANILVQTSVCAPAIDKAKPITPHIERLKRLGADLRYLALNEPLAGGHAAHQPTSCYASIQAVAADVATAIKPLLAIYPELQVGDIEPIGRTADSADWPAELSLWMEAYREATGRPFAFMRADTVWGRAWEEDLRRFAAMTRAAGIPFGVIYTGDFTELSDAEWSGNVARYGVEVEAMLDGPPDQVIFQSWTKWPQRTLPDTDLTTMTGMVRDYLRARTTLAVSREGHVQLRDESGAPMPHANLQVELHDQTPGTNMVEQRITGEVPQGAAAALFALRINAECRCRRADAHLVMTGIRYVEQGPQGLFDQSSWEHAMLWGLFRVR